jgi:hypothetical protein
MGTCIGGRNLKYFIRFLLTAGFHAGVSWAISFIISLTIPSPDEKSAIKVIVDSISTFAGIMSLILLIFGLV